MRRYDKGTKEERDHDMRLYDRFNTACARLRDPESREELAYDYARQCLTEGWREWFRREAVSQRHRNEARGGLDCDI